MLLKTACCTWEERHFYGPRYCMHIVISQTCSVTLLREKNAASHSLFVLNEFITFSWLKLPFLFFIFRTHPFSNMFWILPGVYEKFLCLSLRKAEIETLFDISTWRFSAPTMVLPPGSFYLSAFQRPTFWEVGSGAL